MTMFGLLSPNRQNPVPDRTNSSISIHPRTANCEYCHKYSYDKAELESLHYSDITNLKRSEWGKYIEEDILIIRIGDMKLYHLDVNTETLRPTNATHCPMCGRKLREDA